MTQKSKEVIIYLTQSCPFCRMAKQLMRDKGIDFKEIDVTDDSEMREKLVAMSGGRTTVPQIFADGKSIGGFEALAQLYKSGGEL